MLSKNERFEFLNSYSKDHQINSINHLNESRLQFAHNIKNNNKIN